MYVLLAIVLLECGSQRNCQKNWANSLSLWEKEQGEGGDYFSSLTLTSTARTMRRWR